MEINKTAGTQDQVLGLSSLGYGGTLVINNLAGVLAAGDVFKLFDSASYSNSFASLSPSSPGGGLVWNTTLSPRMHPARAELHGLSSTISSVTFDGTNVILGGTNGPINGSYSVLASTNVIAPLSNWVSIAVGAFDNSGHFSYTKSREPG